MMTALYIALALICIFIAYRRGGNAAIKVAEIEFRAALDNLVDAQDTLNEANTQAVLLHSTHVSLLIDILGEVRDLDPEHKAVVEAIRPFYESQTIH